MDDARNLIAVFGIAFIAALLVWATPIPRVAPVKRMIYQGDGSRAERLPVTNGNF